MLKPNPVRAKLRGGEAIPTLADWKRGRLELIDSAIERIEMRIVQMFASREAAVKAHLPAALQRWTGDPVGWWEGDTLVVETESISARQRTQSPTPMSADAKIVERFTRVGEDELLYRAEVTDLAMYTSVWSISNSFHRVRRIWEYACHEGNYGMVGILTGVRKVERDAGGAGKEKRN